MIKEQNHRAHAPEAGATITADASKQSRIDIMLVSASLKVGGRGPGCTRGVCREHVMDGGNSGKHYSQELERMR